MTKRLEQGAFRWQLWTYARDDRPWGGTDPPAVAYVYAPDRKGEHLRGFAGVLQVDGYAGYRALGRSNQVQLAFCWAHVRRGFYEIAASRPAAAEVLVASPRSTQSSRRYGATRPTSVAPRCRRGIQRGR